MLVSFSGLAGSGKDTAASFLVQQHGFVRFAFADKLKEMCSRAFNIPLVYLHSSEKDHVLDIPIILTREHCMYLIREALKICSPENENFGEIYELVGKEFPSYRKLLQFVGTDMLREKYNSRIWLSPLESMVKTHTDVVVSDARFEDEISLVHELGGVSYTIERPGKKQMSHKSESVPSTLRNLKNDKGIRELASALNVEIIKLMRGSI